MLLKQQLFSFSMSRNSTKDLPYIVLKFLVIYSVDSELILTVFFITTTPSNVPNVVMELKKHGL